MKFSESEIKTWHSMFVKINKENPESYWPLSDTEYYAEQIFNLTEEEDMAMAIALAEQIAERDKRLFPLNSGWRIVGDDPFGPAILGKPRVGDLNYDPLLHGSPQEEQGGETCTQDS